MTAHYLKWPAHKDPDDGEDYPARVYLLDGDALPLNATDNLGNRPAFPVHEQSQHAHRARRKVEDEIEQFYARTKAAKTVGDTA